MGKLLLLIVFFIGCSNSSDNVVSNSSSSQSDTNSISSLSISSSSISSVIDSLNSSNSSIISSSSESSNISSNESSSDTTSLSSSDSVVESSSSSLGVNVVEVSTSEDLKNALLNAKAGDKIVVAPGEYTIATEVVNYAQMDRTVYFYSFRSGTKDAPITIESKDPNNRAIIKGSGPQNSEYVLWIKGEYWIIKDLIIKDGGKGLMLDSASYSLVDNVHIENIGDEGLHLRSGTSNTIIQNCEIISTGIEQPGFGEGIYVGSDNGQWDKYNMACNNNIIDNCIIKTTGAEALDIKEGTEGTVIKNCEIHGDGISGSSNNYADSFIDLKGNGARVFGNIFYQDNNSNVTRGVAIVDRATSNSGSGIVDYHTDMSLEDAQALTANRNWIYQNSFKLDDDQGYMVYAYRGTDNYAWNNIREPDGNEYKGNDPELYLTNPNE